MTLQSMITQWDCGSLGDTYLLYSCPLSVKILCDSKALAHTYCNRTTAIPEYTTVSVRFIILCLPTAPCRCHITVYILCTRKSPLSRRLSAVEDLQRGDLTILERIEATVEIVDAEVRAGGFRYDGKGKDPTYPSVIKPRFYEAHASE